LDKQEKRIFFCGSCQMKFHSICLQNIYQRNWVPEPGESWECARCNPVKYPNAYLQLPTHVSNGRGQYYYKGQAVEALDKITGNPTPATIFMVARDSILLHFNNWSNMYNQWIPSNNPNITIPRGNPVLPITSIEAKERQFVERDGIITDFSQTTIRELLKSCWDTGIIMEDTLLPFVSVLTGQTDKQLIKYRREWKYQAQKKSQVIPVFNPSNPVQSCSIKPTILLGKLWEHGIIKTRNLGYESAISALTGLSIPKIRNWLSDKQYQETKNMSQMGNNLSQTFTNALSDGSLTTLRPYQESVLETAVSAGRLTLEDPASLKSMAIYCGLSELDVYNFLNNKSTV